MTRWDTVVLRLGRDEDRRMGAVVLGCQGAGLRTRLQVVREVAWQVFVAWEQARARHAKGCGCEGRKPTGAAFCPWCGAHVAQLASFDPDSFRDWLLELAAEPATRAFEDAGWTPWRLGPKGKAFEVEDAPVTLLLALALEKCPPHGVEKELREWAGRHAKTWGRDVAALVREAVGEPG